MLSALYFVEGMPWGFQAKALPVFLRTHDASLTLIGLLNLLSLPWMTKALWAPLVDRYCVARFGRRKSWIVPMQACIALTCFVGSFFADGGNLAVLLGLVAVMNLFSATMDIAVDGLAVDLLNERELGTGNITQVVGYKFGTLTSGGLLVWATASTGWQGLFITMAALTLLVMVATLFFPEPRARSAGLDEAAAPGAVVDAVVDNTAAAAPTRDLRRIVETLVASTKVPGMPVLFAVIATYKTGEQLIDSMFKPFLIDQGFTPAEVGLWVSTFGMGASMAGSFVGGLLASRLPVLRALSFAAVFRAVPIFFVFLLTLHPPSPTEVIAVAVTENFFGGLLTTTVFAYMMSRTDKRIGATHFTLLSTIEMLGKAPIPILAGPFAQAYGYSALFLAGTVLSAGFLLLLPALQRAAHDPASVPQPASSSA